MGTRYLWLLSQVAQPSGARSSHGKHRSPVHVFTQPNCTKQKAPGNRGLVSQFRVFECPDNRGHNPGVVSNSEIAAFWCKTSVRKPFADEFNKSYRMRRFFESDPEMWAVNVRANKSDDFASSCTDTIAPWPLESGMLPARRGPLAWNAKGEPEVDLLHRSAVPASRTTPSP
jgi:hypothetical protein